MDAQDVVPASWERRTCRACGGADLEGVFSLGTQPLANALVRPEDANRSEPRYPLDVRRCACCGMAQLAHVVPAGVLYRDYRFRTGSSRRMAEHFGRLMARAADEFVPERGLVVEIGSNDGTALASLLGRPIRVLGVDPASEAAAAAQRRGVPTVTTFFTEAVAREIVGDRGRASLIVACNVLGHVDRLDDFLAGVRALLRPDGAFVFEVPYLGDLLRAGAWDTVYHEHLSYFTVRPLVELLGDHGLWLQQVERFPIHGGSIRCTAVHGVATSAPVEAWVQTECDRGVGSPGAFAVLARRTEECADRLRKQLRQFGVDGIPVAGYGAPAKATVVLNRCGINSHLLPYLMDSTPEKQGLLVPGTHQPVLPPTVLAERNPDVLLLLAWNHADEVYAREHDFLARGGQFLLPHDG